MYRVLVSFLLGCLLVTSAHAGTINRPSKSFGGTSFINGVVPQASDWNGDTDTIYSEFNGNITNVNINASAAIAASKINPDGFTTSIRTVNSAPCHILDENDQAADARRWALCITGGQLQVVTQSDVAATQNTWLTIDRSLGSFNIGGTGGTNIINGATTFNQAVTFTGGTSLTPTGSVQMYMGTTAPSGWLLMNGSSNSCTGSASANANLCAQLVGLYGSANYKGSASSTITVDTSSDEIIHTAHGHSIGDRVHFSSTTTLPGGLSATTVYCIRSITTDRYTVSTTCGGALLDITSVGSGTHSDYFNFVTPDTRGRQPIGTGAGTGLTARTIGATGGEETHVLSTAEMPTHNHTITDPGHVHREQVTDGSGNTTGLYNPSGSGGSPVAVLYGDTQAVNMSPPQPALNTASNTTGISLASAGSSSAHAVMDPFLVMTFIIKL